MSIETEFNKEVKGLKFKLPEEVYDVEKRKYRNSKKIYGKVEKNRMFAVTSKKNNKVEFVNDFANLPKSYKNHILQYFDDNESKRTLYLVKSDYDKEPVKKSKTKTKNSNNPKKPKTPSATNTKANKDKCCNDSRLIVPMQGKKVKMAMNNFYTYVNSKKKKRMNKHAEIQS